MMIYRKTWPEFIAGFFEPLCYLLLVGIGLGPIIGQIAGPGGGEVSYISFAAPAMLAASAMNGAIYDSTFSVLFQLLRYGKVFVAVQATPLTSSDIVLGQIIWAQLRAVIYSTAFFAIMLAIGTVHSVWAVLVLPAASLAAFAFGAIGLASAAYMRSWQDLEFVTIGMLASYLFSATFFPLSVYPRPVQVLVQLTPLYHASDF